MSQIRSQVAAVVLALATYACGGEQQSDEAARDLTLSPAESLATLNDAPRTPEPPAPPTQPVVRRPAAPPSLEAGTVAVLAANDTLTSRHNKAGEAVTAILPAALRNARGIEVIPAGAVFHGTITDIAPAESPGGTGRLALSFDRVVFGGQSYAVAARVDSVGARMKGRGVTAGDAAKVGAGAVVGALAGRLIGGNKTGTAVGAAAGTAAGVGVAAATRDVDIILDAGAPIQLVLTSAFEKRPAS